MCRPPQWVQILLYLRLHNTHFRHNLLHIGTWVYFHVGTFTNVWLNLSINLRLMSLPLQCGTSYVHGLFRGAPSLQDLFVDNID